MQPGLPTFAEISAILDADSRLQAELDRIEYTYEIARQSTGSAGGTTMVKCSELAHALLAEAAGKRGGKAAGTERLEARVSELVAVLEAYTDPDVSREHWEGLRERYVKTRVGGGRKLKAVP